MPGSFRLIAFVFVRWPRPACRDVVVSRAGMEISEWKGYSRKEGVSMVVKDMGEARQFRGAKKAFAKILTNLGSSVRLGYLMRSSPKRSRRCTLCWRGAWCCDGTVMKRLNQRLGLKIAVSMRGLLKKHAWKDWTLDSEGPMN